MPLLEFTLNQGEIICAQSGAMKWMGSGIKMETSMAGGIGGALKRKLKMCIRDRLMHTGSGAALLLHRGGIAKQVEKFI